MKERKKKKKKEKRNLSKKRKRHKNNNTADELWYGVSEKCFARFLQGWARAFTDPVEVRVHRHAEGAVCVFGFVLGVYIPSGDKFHDAGASGVGLLWQFPCVVCGPGS